MAKVGRAKVKLQFRCNDVVEDMAAGVDGRPFCTQCQRSLLDFREMQLPQVLDYVSKNNGCGVFKTEHVEPEEIAILTFTNVKKYFIALGMLLKIEISNAQTIPDTLKNETEIVEAIKDGVSEIKKESKNERKQKKFNRKVYDQRNLGSVEYGLFVYKKFPFVCFRRKIYKRYSTSWFDDEVNKQVAAKLKKSGIVFLGRENKP